MISLLIGLLVICLVFGVLFYILQLLPMPDPFGTIARLVLLLILVLVLIGWLLPLAGIHAWGLR